MKAYPKPMVAKQGYGCEGGKAVMTYLSQGYECHDLVDSWHGLQGEGEMGRESVYGVAIKQRRALCDHDLLARALEAVLEGLVRGWRGVLHGTAKVDALQCENRSACFFEHSHRSAFDSGTFDASELSLKRLKLSAGAALPAE